MVAVLEGVVARRRWPVAGRWRWASLTTPERMWVSLLALAACLVFAAGAAGLAVRAVDQRTQDIADRLGPVGTGSLTLYSSLADANAALVNEVLARPVGGPQPSRSTFDDALAEAGRDVAGTASRTGDDPPTGDRLADVAATLPVYSGLAEQARSGSGPARTDALRRATDLMNAAILPNAELVQIRQAGQVDIAYDATRGVPVTGLVFGLGAVAGLFAVQVLLWRRTRRVFTLGTVAATVVVAAAGAWWGVAGTSAAQHLATSRAHLEMVTDALGPAQVAVAQARAAEGIALAVPVAAADDEFRDRVLVLVREDPRGGMLGGALGAARALAPDARSARNVDVVVDAVHRYVAAHDRVRALVANGRTGDATRSLVTPAPGSSASAFATLAGALNAAVDQETGAFRSEIEAARSWRDGLMVVLFVAGAVAVACVARGLAHRLGEYR